MSRSHHFANVSLNKKIEKDIDDVIAAFETQPKAWKMAITQRVIQSKKER